MSSHTVLFHRNVLEGFDKANGELNSAVTGLHNLVHDFLSGTNALSHSAANDPIFVVRDENQFYRPYMAEPTRTVSPFSQPYTAYKSLMYWYDGGVHVLTKTNE